MGKQPVHLGGYGRIRKELNNAPRHYFTYIRHFCKLFHSGASQRLYCAEATRQILCRLRADVGYAYGKYESAQSAVLAALNGGHKVVYSALAEALQTHVVPRAKVVQIRYALELQLLHEKRRRLFREGIDIHGVPGGVMGEPSRYLRRAGKGIGTIEVHAPVLHMRPACRAHRRLFHLSLRHVALHRRKYLRDNVIASAYEHP